MASAGVRRRSSSSSRSWSMQGITSHWLAARLANTARRASSQLQNWMIISQTERTFRIFYTCVRCKVLKSVKRWSKNRRTAGDLDSEISWNFVGTWGNIVLVSRDGCSSRTCWMLRWFHESRVLHILKGKIERDSRRASTVSTAYMAPHICIYMNIYAYAYFMYTIYTCVYIHTRVYICIHLCMYTFFWNFRKIAKGVIVILINRLK